MFQGYQINELSKYKCYIVNIFNLHTHEFSCGWVCVCVCMLWGHWIELLKDQHYFTCTHWFQATPNSECWNIFPNFTPMLCTHNYIKNPMSIIFNHPSRCTRLIKNSMCTSKVCRSWPYPHVKSSLNIMHHGIVL